MFLEVSAKTAHNVEEAFTLSAKQILLNIESSKSEVQLSVIIRVLLIILLPLFIFLFSYFHIVNS